jgi:hypothetical protein
LIAPQDHTRKFDAIEQLVTRWIAKRVVSEFLKGDNCARGPKDALSGLGDSDDELPALEPDEVDEPPSFKHPERYEDAPDEGTVKDDDDVEIGDECKAETEVESDRTLERAMQDGLPAEKEAELRRIVSKHADVFRTRLGADPAVDDKPVQILPEEEVPPHRAKVRRCRPPQLAFLAGKVKELEWPGVVGQNTNSRRASAPHSVPTSNAEGDRLTVDLRQVHQRTEPIVWTVSDRESCAHRLAASACSASADFSNGYWQLALDEDSQECQSSVVPDGVYPPRPVLHGQVSATACAQAAVRIMLQDRDDKLLSWLDDLRLHCRDADGLLRVQETFLIKWAVRGVKLGAARMDLCSQEVRCCGRVVSKDGVWLDPSSVSAPAAMQPPVTGADLQQFVCAQLSPATPKK